MSGERNSAEESFLGRWSRVKAEARDAAAPPVAPTPEAPPAKESRPELPPLENLTLDSDFSPFFHPEVDEDVRRSALRRLFSDPHFNVMDGLDVYIDDYSKSEAVPAAMLASLKQAQRILDWAAEKTDEADARAAASTPALANEPPRSLRSSEMSAPPDASNACQSTVQPNDTMPPNDET